MTRTTRPETMTPPRYALTAREAHELRRQKGRFRYWMARTEGARARCLACGIALVERMEAGTRRQAGTC